eukprot:jgi/Psemu1/13677/gm1.13677_g
MAVLKANQVQGQWASQQPQGTYIPQRKQCKWYCHFCGVNSPTTGAGAPGVKPATNNRPHTKTNKEDGVTQSPPGTCTSDPHEGVGRSIFFALSTMSSLGFSALDSAVTDNFLPIHYQDGDLLGYRNIEKNSMFADDSFNLSIINSSSKPKFVNASTPGRTSFYKTLEGPNILST